MKKILLLAALGNSQELTEPPGGLCFDDPIFEDFCKQDDFCLSENRNGIYFADLTTLKNQNFTKFRKIFIFVSETK